MSRGAAERRQASRAEGGRGGARGDDAAARLGPDPTAAHTASGDSAPRRARAHPERRPAQALRPLRCARQAEPEARVAELDAPQASHAHGPRRRGRAAATCPGGGAPRRHGPHGLGVTRPSERAAGNGCSGATAAAARAAHGPGGDGPPAWPRCSTRRRSPLKSLSQGARLGRRDLARRTPTARRSGPGPGPGGEPATPRHRPADSETSKDPERTASPPPGPVSEPPG